MVNYFLSEEQKEIQSLCRRIAQEKIAPVAAQYDRETKFPWDMVKVMAEAGLFGLFIEQEYGGLGGGSFDLCLATEELSRACGGIALSLAATALGAFPIIFAGTEEQKKKYLPDIAAGKKLAAFGITEASSGSDAGNIKARAVRKGDHYYITGAKQWVTNGEVADVYTVVAITNLQCA